MHPNALLDLSTELLRQVLNDGWRIDSPRVVALLMGGSQVEPLVVGSHRGLAVGLDYFVLELLVLGLVFIPLEGLFPLHRARVVRAGWQTDLKHFFVSHAGV